MTPQAPGCLSKREMIQPTQKTVVCVGKDESEYAVVYSSYRIFSVRCLGLIRLTAIATHGVMIVMTHLPVPRRFFGVLVFTLSTAGATLPAAGQAIDTTGQIAAYVEVQVALAADDYDTARRIVQDLLAIADATSAPLVRSVAQAQDIDTMRARFKPLSEYLAAQELPVGYARAYCPMYDGGSNWVQADGPIRNPFFGSTMLTCGVIDAAPGAHMDHTPRHGGTVFMAPDGFYHIEGTHPEDGLFRLYATNNYREPVDMSEWSGRVVLDEAYDEQTDEFTEVRLVDLFVSPDGQFLEAVFGDIGFPAEFITKVVFETDFPEERFDFIFSEYTREGAAGADVRDPVPVTTGAPANIPLAERVRPDIPESTAELVSQIGARDMLLQELIEAGRFTEIFIPALQAKELGLELTNRLEDLALRDRNEVRIAVRHLVRASHLLDWYGDLGNRQQVSGAYDVFAEAWNRIARIYSARQ